MAFILQIQWDTKSGEDPNDNSRDILKGFGTTYHQAGETAFMMNPCPDKGSLI